MHFREHQKCFNALLEHKDIVQFLTKDPCGALCDKYQLAIVFIFFVRAKFSPEDYTVRNFFLALTISHDCYEEWEAIEGVVMFNYMIINKEMRYKQYHWERMRLFQRMNFQGLVDPKVCQKVCCLFQHTGFYKPRQVNHTGTMLKRERCDRCGWPGRKDFNPDIDPELEEKKELEPFRYHPTPQCFYTRTEANLAITVC